MVKVITIDPAPSKPKRAARPGDLISYMPSGGDKKCYGLVLDCFPDTHKVAWFGSGHTAILNQVMHYCDFSLEEPGTRIQLEQK